MGSFSLGGLVISLLLGCGFTVLGFYIFAKRNKRKIALLRGLEIGLAVTTVLMIYGELVIAAGPNGFQGVGGLGIIVFFAIGIFITAVTALPIAILTTGSPRAWVRVLGAIGVIVISSIIIYAFSFAWESSSGPTMEAGQYRTEKWNTYTDTTLHFKIDYPPELSISNIFKNEGVSAPASNTALQFAGIFSTTTEYAGFSIILDVNDVLGGVQGADYTGACQSLCIPYQTAQTTTFGGYPTSINFLEPTYSSDTYFNTSLHGVNEEASLNVMLSPSTSGDEASITQDIYMGMLSSFQFTAPFTPAQQ